MPTRSSRSAALLALLVLLPTALALGAAGPWPSARPEWPQPPLDERLLFFVQRSMNPNTVVYRARLDGDERLDAKTPVEAYWLRFNNDGERRELKFTEKAFAYGVVSEPLRERPGAFAIHLAAYGERRIVVDLDRAGRPRAMTTIGGQPARLASVYLVVDDSGLLPGIDAIELHGFAAADGRPVSEQFTPQTAPDPTQW